MEKLKRFSPETAVECLLAFLGLVIMVVSLAYGFGTLRRPGPGLYPFFIGLFISVFSAALLISDAKAQRPTRSLRPSRKKRRFSS